MQLLCAQTHCLVGHLICQVSIWPLVVMKLEAVACVTVADSYAKGVISLILVAGERTTQREIERMTFSVNKK